MAARSIPQVAVPRSDVSDAPRHAALVRITHWISAISFLGLVVSGFAIILAHPRFYWGETGGLGTPSVLDLPLPFMLGGPSGWGRSLHFLSAWVCVLNGALYVLAGLATQHFRRNLLPAPSDLSWRTLSQTLANQLRFRRPAASESLAYNVIQRLTYVLVIFGLLPLMIWTGFAMSPAIVSVYPFFVTSLGGQETARTVHFFAADVLLLFLIVHLLMIWRAGFWTRVSAMITGRVRASQDNA